VSAVSVVVKDGTGKPIGAATTDADGNYLVDNLPDGPFTVCFGLSGLDYLVTQANVGDDTADSDADPATGCTAPIPSASLNVDAGLVSPPNRLGGAVWADANRNGLQDSGESLVPGVTVVVKDGRGNQIGAATTDAAGRYRVDNLPDGTFTVCFGMSTLPDAYADNLVTKPNAGDDIMDSDADQTTGCTTPLNLGPDNRENLTVDAGTVAPTNRLGDYVWIDGNRNGLQEAGEPGVLGVTVVLRAGGVEVARTTTNANGRYLFATMPDGSYRVCFDLGALPAAVADYTVTQANAGDGADLDVDSDADSTGCTPATTLGVGSRANFGLDAGLVAVPFRLRGQGRGGRPTSWKRLPAGESRR
jgi:hypothetical protein